MATPSRVVKGLTYGAIGANLYIFAKWNVTPVAPGSKPDSPERLDARRRHKDYMQTHYTLSHRGFYTEGRWYTALTSAFSHSSLGHLAVNMFMLHEAANIASYVGVGPVKLAALALGSALGGSAGSLYDASARARAGEPDMPGLGASGMVQGMLMATMLAAPWLPMNVLFIPVTISYRTVVGGFIAWDMWKLYDERRAGQKKANWSGSYVGYAAHLGGAVFGSAFYLLAMRRGGRLPIKLR